MKGFRLYLFRSFKDLLTTITTIILINISPKNTIDRIVSYNTGDDSRSIGNVTAKSITDIIGATNILYIFIQRTLCSFAPFSALHIRPELQSNMDNIRNREKG